MRNLKRALSLALSTVMLMGMMVVGSGAAGYDDVSSEDNQEAIEVMQAVGIMTGDDAGNFNPDQQVTRGEMAVIMTKVLDLNTGNYSISAMPFVDVPAWAQSYVAAIYAEGVTGGTSATTYGTDEPVTAAQAALMLMRALGYFQYSSDFNDGWLLATIRQAGRIDLFEGIDAGAEEALTRNEVAQLVLNTLEATMVEPTGSQGVQIGDVVVGSTIKYEDITKTGSKYNAIDKANDGSGKNYVQLGEDLFDGDLEKSVGQSDDFGRPSIKWEYDNKDVGTYADEADEVYTIKVKAEDIYADLGLSESTSATYIVDGGAGTTCTISKSGSTEFGGAGTLTEVYYDSDEETITICSVKTYVGKVDAVYTADDVKDDEDPYITITPMTGSIKNDKFETTAFDEDDIVLYTYANDEIQSVELAELVEGVELTKVTTGKSIVAGGETYTMSANYYDDGTELKDDISVYLDSYGNVIYTEVYEAASTDYAFVLNVSSKPDDFAESYINKAKLVMVDGTTQTVTLDSDKQDHYKALENTFVSYTVDEDGIYELKAKDKTNTSDWGTKFAVENGKALLATNETSKNTYKVYGNDETVFIIYDKKAEEYTIYTGVDNVPTITKAQSAYFNYDGETGTRMVAEYVYISVADSSAIDNSTGSLIYIVYDKDAKLNDEKDRGEYYTYNAYVDGELTTVDVAKDKKLSADVVASKLSYDKYDVVTNWDTYAKEEEGKDYYQANFTGTEKASKGNIYLENAWYAYASDVTVYKIEDGEFVKSSIGAVRDDEDDEVIAIFEDGEVTYLFITVVDDEDDGKVETDETGSKISGTTVADKTITSADTLKMQANGVYTFEKETTLSGVEDIRGGIENNMFFKFVTTEADDYVTLTIYNASGKTVYREGSTFKAVGPHFFYVQVLQSEDGDAPINAGTGDMKNNPLTVGTYDYTVTSNDGTVLLRGDFKIQK